MHCTVTSKLPITLSDDLSILNSELLRWDQHILHLLQKIIPYLYSDHLW